MTSDFAEIKRQLLSGKKKSMEVVRKGLSTGSTLLNLACSGQADVGFLPGTYVFLVGDSASGKSFLSLTCLAEAALNPSFKNYRFIYDNAENGALMDIGKFFGQETARRLETATISNTLEGFFYNLDDAFTEARPFIYVLDSMDCLTTEEETDKFSEGKQASRAGKQATGSYGTSKAKANSAGIRRIIPKLKDTGSILIIISQTRDNIGFGSQFNPKTRSGGHALRFYATLEIWSSIRVRIKKTVRGKERQLGIICKAEVKKNRLTGRERSVEIPILHSSGIDDLGSCCDYLIDEGHWSKSGVNVAAGEFDHKGSRDKLIAKIEDEGREQELRQLVVQVWTEIELASHVPRKRRYD